jgi:hypothetical protein
MLYIIKVTFKTLPPSPDEILKKLRVNTGLVDIALSPRLDAFRHPEKKFEDRHFWMLYFPDKIEIKTYTFRSWYLIEATIIAMIDLGGETKYKLQDWASKKWEEVKDQDTDADFAGLSTKGLPPPWGKGQE